MYRKKFIVIVSLLLTGIIFESWSSSSDEEEEFVWGKTGALPDEESETVKYFRSLKPEMGIVRLGLMIGAGNTVAHGSEVRIIGGETGPFGGESVSSHSATKGPSH